jgi:predicted phage terminase large subunit-like protein
VSDASLVNVGNADYLSVLEQDLARRQEGRSLEDQATELGRSLWPFVRASWHVLRPDEPFVDNWHIGALCEQLEEITCDRLKRLLIWVPPGSMKTLTVDVDWPAWEWITKPWLRYMTCSYDMEIQIEQGALPSRALIESEWYQALFPHIELREDLNKRASFANTRGGARYCAAPNAKKVTGRHVHRIVIDDPNDPGASELEMLGVQAWHDEKLTTRLLPGGAKVVIQQRLHERDLSGYLVERDDWRVLCLPECYDPKHPFVWPDDPRSEGELLWPARFDEAEHDRRLKGLTSHRAAGQLQQTPTSPEGDLLKRRDWRFYDPRIRAEERWGVLPLFKRIVVSCDTPLKDKESNDLCSIQVWGVDRADRYLLDVETRHMNYGTAKRTIAEKTRWARTTWRRTRVDVLIEGAGFGVELIVDLKRELGGVQKIAPGKDGDKVMRATAAASDLEGHNCFLPGYGPPAHPIYDEAITPADVAGFVTSLSKFPNGAHDDDVDAWSQAINWLRGKASAPLRTASTLIRRRQGSRVAA